MTSPSPSSLAHAPPALEPERLAGGAVLLAMPALKPMPPFAPVVVDLLDALSQLLLNHQEARRYPDVAALGFFCRRASIAGLMRDGAPTQGTLGRGVTFHVAPANVPLQFAYSWCMGLLAGNSCIVRVSSRLFPQVALVCMALSELFAEPRFAALRERTAIVRYGHDSAMNAFLSRLCDVRLIWGGDATIAQLRTAPLPPRAFDVTFANRASACVIDAAAYLATVDRARVAVDFFNDTYFFDQNACASPGLVYWIGTAADVHAAQTAFYDALHAVLVARRYGVASVTALDKLTAAYRAAIAHQGTVIPPAQDTLIQRVQLASLPTDWPALSCAGGFFVDVVATDLVPLLHSVTRAIQTITCVGMAPAQVAQARVAAGAVGVDRVVRCGQAGQFGRTWDGYDLISHLSRRIVVAA